jgi:hypothetical protein
MFYTFKEQDYVLHICGTRLCFTHLRNTTMLYTFKEQDYVFKCVKHSRVPQMCKT